MKNTVLAFSLCTLLMGCAATYQAEGSGRSPTSAPGSDEIVFPDFQGDKTRIGVFPIALTQKTLDQFPEYSAQLQKKSVGFSLWNRITDALWDTNRFTFIEVSEEVVKGIIEQIWLGQSGMVDPSSAMKMGNFKQAEDFIYGEISEFGADEVETVKGLRAKKTILYRIGVHLRYVHGETLEYIPATATGKGTTIEEASERAIRKGILKLVKRMR